MVDLAKVAKPNQHRTDPYAEKLDKGVENLQRKKEQYGLQRKSSNKPAGGFDDTPIPKAPPGFTVKFIFHRAHHLPSADLNTLSSDPFVVAELRTGLPTRHKQDPQLQYRTRTIQRTVEPVWDQEWIVANVPATGFELKARILDEDPADHDDPLGNVHVDVNSLSENWPGMKEESFKIEKRSGSKRAYFLQGCAAMFKRGVPLSGTLVLSVEVLGKTEGNNGGRAWTVGPCNWTKHFSPMIGMLTGIKDPGQAQKAGEKKHPEKYNFQANQIQLAGPVPGELYHRYVEFKPFVAGMFTGTSFRGWVLNRALHHQHARIYNFDRHTLSGSFPKPCRDMTLQFLDLVHYDEGGRIFTYVITLDGQWRFTETGKEFGVDLLSKHTMHSDVNVYIAFSGEFFIRRHSSVPHHSEDHKEGEGQDGIHSATNGNREKGSPTLDAQPTHPPDDIDGGPPQGDPPKDPESYTLVIDNDSGTYRPNASLLPQLRSFLHKQLPGLHVITLDCNGDKEKMDKWKGEQRARKKKEGKGVVVRQQSSSSMSGSSVSSSDEEDLERRADAMRSDTQTGEAVGAGATTSHDRHLKEKIEGKVEKAMDKIRGGDEDEKAQGKREIAEAEALTQHAEKTNGNVDTTSASVPPTAAPTTSPAINTTSHNPVLPDGAVK